MISGMTKTLASVLVILVIAVSGYAIVDYLVEQKRNEAMVTFRAQADSAVQFADSLTAVVSARDTQITRLESEVERLRTRRPSQPRVDSLRHEVDSLYAELSDSVTQAYDIIPKQHVLIAEQDSTIRVLDRVIARQDTLLVLKDSTITDLRSGVDSLRTILAKAPEPPRQKRIFGLLPTRTTAVLGGVVLGVLLHAAVSR